MKRLAFLSFVWILLAGCLEAQASWVIDPDRFHVSVHGQTSCVECHGTMAKDKPHPDPGNVNQKIEDFFTPDTCAGCHETVEDYLKAGVHGGVDVGKPEDIQNCINCHDPHYARHDAGDSKFNPAIPIGRQCGVCHDARDQLPLPAKDDAACLSCHRRFEPGKPEEVKREAAFCFYCHAGENAAGLSASIPFIDAKGHGRTPHGGLSCRTCHPKSAQYGHANQSVADCRLCHLPHDEKVAHDAHIAVSCEACHLSGVSVRRNTANGRIEANKNRFGGSAGNIHHMAITDKEASCGRCHYSGNAVGASAMVLPAKSILCMPCHTATFSVGDTVTLLSLAAFGLGIFSLMYALLSGGYGDGAPKGRAITLALAMRDAASTIFSRKIGVIFKSLVFDALLQKRLFAQSPSRWGIHALIFYPFVLRFCWGIVALILSLAYPQGALTRVLLDKNHAITGLVFDLTGLTVLLGAGLAVALKSRRPAEQFTGLPKTDWAASALLGGIVAVGFVLEGMRIAMTGFPAGGSWAFLGYGIAKTFAGMTGLSDIYGYIWYLHAVLTGLFMAYLPFSRMLHMIVAPVVLAMNRLKEERK
jgi:hypothetical protein